MSSVAYWYATEPGSVARVPPVKKRAPVMRDARDVWLYDRSNQTASRPVELNAEMQRMKARAAKKGAVD